MRSETARGVGRSTPAAYVISLVLEIVRNSCERDLRHLAAISAYLGETSEVSRILRRSFRCVSLMMDMILRGRVERRLKG